MNSRCLRRILSTFQTNCGDSESLDWTTQANDVRVDPPKNSVAVVVDVRDGQGAIDILKTRDKKNVVKAAVVEGDGT